jgi:poly-gamma-glutamate capsule biosynthesis protein CapA/YwtB (metallophosphatase superfamily)
MHGLGASAEAGSGTAAPTVALLGDVMLGRGVAKELESRQPADLWSPEVREVAGTCDAVLCNLECCISERGSPTTRIAGKPFFFRGPPAAMDSLGAIGVRAVGAANNHALDFGEEALEDTLTHIRRAGIAATGAGLGPQQARQGAIIEAGGLRLGVVSVSDHPPEYAAQEGHWGISYADLSRGAPDWLLAELARLGKSCDATLAFLHWGPNMRASPAAWQRQLGQQLLEAGADVVAGHSAHVFHGVGWSTEGLLLYDLGDALDDYAIDKVLRNDLGVIAIWTPGASELELVGLHLDYCRTELARGEHAEWIATRLDRACRELATRVERTEEGRFRILPA